MIKSLFLRTALGAVMGAGLMTLSAAPASASVADGVAQIQNEKYADAMRTFKKEAAKDNGDAMYYIGDMLRNGSEGGTAGSHHLVGKGRLSRERKVPDRALSRLPQRHRREDGSSSGADLGP